MLTNQLILSFAHNRWHEKWSEKQSILRLFAEQGNRAVLVEPPVNARQVLAGKVAAVPPGLHRIEEGLYHYVPSNQLPSFHAGQRLLNRITRSLRFAALKRDLEAIALGTRPILYIWHPDFLEAIGRFDEVGVVYHKFDRYPIVGEPSPELLRREREVIRCSQVRVAISRQIIAMDPMFADFDFVPNGAEFEAFHEAMLHRERNEPADLASIPRPRIGYVGAINQKIDFGLLNHIATQMRDTSVVLIGPEMAKKEADLVEWNKLKKQRNAYFLGLKAFDQLPSYVANLDVGIIVNTKEKADWVEFCYPLKLHEYLACGLPVVSTDIPSVREFEHVVRIANSRQQWVAALREALADVGSNVRTERIRVGRENSWAGRVAKISSLIQQALPQTRG